MVYKPPGLTASLYAFFFPVTLSFASLICGPQAQNLRVEEQSFLPIPSPHKLYFLSSLVLTDLALKMQCDSQLLDSSLFTQCINSSHPSLITQCSLLIHRFPPLSLPVPYVPLLLTLWCAPQSINTDPQPWVNSTMCSLAVRCISWGPLAKAKWITVSGSPTAAGSFVHPSLLVHINWFCCWVSCFLIFYEYWSISSMPAPILIMFTEKETETEKSGKVAHHHTANRPCQDSHLVCLHRLHL